METVCANRRSNWISKSDTDVFDIQELKAAGERMTSPTQRSLKFTVYCKPQPQGSIRAFTPKGWKRPILTSDNPNLKSFRQEVSKAALLAVQEAGMGGLMFDKHVPVQLAATFYFQRPPSVPKKRVCHVVKPDLSKLVRSVEDSLSGIVFADDAQIVSYGKTEKFYGAPERTEIEVTCITVTVEKGVQ